MFPIRRRWPILTGLVALVAYLANHYHIAGLEHLKLKPNQASQTPSESRLPSLGSGDNYASSAHDVYGHQGPGRITSYGNSPFAVTEAQPEAVRWPEGLSESERFALLGEQALQDSLASKTPTTTAPTGEPQLLTGITPIPVPPEYANLRPATGNLPSTAGERTSLPPPGDRFVAIQPTAPPGTAAQSNSNQPRESERAARPNSFSAPRTIGSGASAPGLGAPGIGRIRVASFNVESLGPAKLDKPHVMMMLVSILRQYDVVALQQIRSSRDDILPMLVERLNQSGRRYDYIIGPRVGREAFEQFGYIFDTDRLVTDRYRLYTVDDPADLIAYEPLVAWFRCKQPPESTAFTFSLVNVRIDDKNAATERAILPDLVDAVMRDGREEDDWIMLGDIRGDTAGLAFMQRSGVRFAVRDIPTEVSGMRMLDSIFFSKHATSEYSGRAGAYDFLRKYNLTLEQAQEVSNHLPVWAEFYQVEGGTAAGVAPGILPSEPNSSDVF
ncbi:MAG: hypothetical protein Aurels2KO_11660 [Aureliella sp.]